MLRFVDRITGVVEFEQSSSTKLLQIPALSPGDFDVPREGNAGEEKFLEAYNTRERTIDAAKFILFWNCNFNRVGNKGDEDNDDDGSVTFRANGTYRANCDSDWLFYGPPRCQRGSGSHKVRYSITVRELLRAAMAFQASASTPANFVPSPRSPVILSPIDRPNNSSLFHPLSFVLLHPGCSLLA